MLTSPRVNRTRPVSVLPALLFRFPPRSPSRRGSWPLVMYMVSRRVSLARSLPVYLAYGQFESEVQENFFQKWVAHPFSQCLGRPSQF